jgi:hypothetical protein
MSSIVGKGDRWEVVGHGFEQRQRQINIDWVCVQGKTLGLQISVERYDIRCYCMFVPDRNRLSKFRIEVRSRSRLESLKHGGRDPGRPHVASRGHRGGQ